MDTTPNNPRPIWAVTFTARNPLEPARMLIHNAGINPNRFRQKAISNTENFGDASLMKAAAVPKKKVQKIMYMAPLIVLFRGGGIVVELTMVDNCRRFVGKEEREHR
jgi:hypothetical protein